MAVPRSLLTFALLALSAVACDDDSTQPDALTVDDLQGTWIASSFVHTNNADASEQIDVVLAGGELRTTILEDGRARTWIEFGTFMDEWDHQLTLSGNTLTSTPAEAARGVRVYTFELNGDTMTLTNVNAEFDFTLSGADPVPSTEVIVLNR